MSDSLNPLTWSGFTVENGTAGVASPWINQGSTFSVAPLEQAASSLVKQGQSLGSQNLTLGPGVPGGTNPENTLNPSDPSKGSTLNSGNVDLGSMLGGAGGLTDAINAYFIRAVVVILGFIFIAAGLSIMGHGQPIEAVLSKVTK